VAHPFLTEAWFAEVEKLQAEAPEPPAALKELTFNVVVQGSPEGDQELHMTGGRFERGFVDGAPTKLTVPYEVARSLFVEGDQQAAMQAFMSGQIRIEGDMTKLMVLQSQAAVPPTPEQKEFQEKLRALTA
jgi:hypothetical protein